MAKDKDRIQRVHKGFHSPSTKTMVAPANHETVREKHPGGSSQITIRLRRDCNTRNWQSPMAAVTQSSTRKGMHQASI